MPAGKCIPTAANFRGDGGLRRMARYKCVRDHDTRRTNRVSDRQQSTLAQLEEVRIERQLFSSSS
jgi:hypothetical protein